MRKIATKSEFFFEKSEAKRFSLKRKKSEAKFAKAKKSEALETAINIKK
jgi:hypothetical protein